MGQDLHGKMLPLLKLAPATPRATHSQFEPATITARSRFAAAKPCLTF